MAKSRRVYTWPRELPEERRGPYWEAMIFTGWNDLRIGVYFERHPGEWMVSLHVPFASIWIQRVR